MRIIFSSENLLSNILYYLKAPNQEKEDIRKSEKIWNVIRILSWCYFIAFVTLILWGFLFKSPPSNALETFIDNNNILYTAILTILVGPLMEESIFRLPLRFKPIFFLISSFLILINVFAYFPTSLFGNNVGLSDVVVSLLLSLVIFLVAGLSFVKERIERFYETRFLFIYYFSAFSFGFLHITNYTDLKQVNLVLIPVLVIPQLIVGLGSGFIRVKYGFWYGFILHSIYNSILFFPTTLAVNSKNLVESAVGDLLLLLLLLLIIVGGFSFVKDLSAFLDGRKKVKDIL